MRVKLPGVGIVEVPSGQEAAFVAYMAGKDPAEQLKKHMDALRTEIKDNQLTLSAENRANVKAICDAVAGIKIPQPVVTVEAPKVSIPAQNISVPAPIVTVQAPEVSPQVTIQAQPKAKKIRIGNIERNRESRISGCEIQVVEWSK